MKLYSGDVLTRKTGEKYLVAHTGTNKFQLISLVDGNRWTNDGIEVEREQGNYGTCYIYRAQVYTVGVGNFGDFTVETKQERRAVEELKVKLELASHQPCEDVCVEPTCDFFEEDIELTEKDINYVVSHAAIHMNPSATAGQMVNKISQDVYDFLVGKE